MTTNEVYYKTVTAKNKNRVLRFRKFEVYTAVFIPPLFRQYRYFAHLRAPTVGIDRPTLFFPASLHRPLSHTYVCLLIEFYVAEPYLWYRRGDNAQSRRPSATWPCRVQLLQSFTHLARSFSSRVNFVKSCFPVAAYTILNNN